MEEDEKDSDLLSSGEDDLLSVIDLKDFTQEATKIIEDSNWEIWKPKSEQGMVLLSQGTKWLTSHSWNAPDAEYGEINPESWNFQNWGKAYVIISKDKIDRVTGLPKKFLFQAGWGGMYSPSYARYSFASWLIKLNSPKLIKWAAQSKFPFVSNRLLSIVATDELKKSGGVYTYPSNVYPSWSERINVTKIVIKPGTTRINAHSFSNFGSITEVEIPDTVTIIGNSAFSGMVGLTEIKLPPNLTTIGENAFNDCIDIKTIIIPDKVRKIGESAFARCSSLKTLFIPNSVKTMGIILKQWGSENTLPNLTIYCEASSKPEGWDENWNATHVGESWDPDTRTWSIADVNKVEKVIWGASKPTVTEEVKKNINEEDGEDEILLTTVSDRKVLLDTPKWKVVRVLSPEAYSEFIKKGNAPIEGRLNHILSAGAEEFYNRTRGVALYVLIDKQSDDRYLFAPKMYAYTIMGYDDYNKNIMDFLRNIGTDESLQNWFKRAFTATTRNIEKLQQTQAEVIKRKYTYVYPDDEPIEYRDVAEQIKIVTITEGTTEIKDYAFNNFKGVKEIIIPKSVKKIGKYAFSSCNSLISIVIPEGVTKIEENTFWGCHRLEKVTLSNTITEIGDSAFWSCDKLWEINIPRSVTKIGDAAFLGCHTLPELFIPASVQTIGTQGIEIRNSYYDTAGYGKATIYCEAQSKPSGWNDSWTTPEVEVVWGAKPSLREEKEIDLEVMPYAKPEFEADGWVVMSIGTRAAPVELTNGKVFDWDPIRYTSEQNEEALIDDGYVFFSFKPNGATVEDIYLYEPMYPNDINIYQGGSVPMSNLLNYAESDKLRKWVINKFPEYKDDMIEHMVGYMVF